MNAHSTDAGDAYDVVVIGALSGEIMRSPQL